MWNQKNYNLRIAITTPASEAMALDIPIISPKGKDPLNNGFLGTIISDPGFTFGVLLNIKKDLNLECCI